MPRFCLFILAFIMSAPAMAQATCLDGGIADADLAVLNDLYIGQATADDWCAVQGVMINFVYPDTRPEARMPPERQGPQGKGAMLQIEGHVIPDALWQLDQITQLMLHDPFGRLGIPDPDGSGWQVSGEIVISEKLGNLKRLENLAIIAYAVHHVPDRMTELQNLQEVALFTSNLAAVPEDIGNLQSLQELQLFGGLKIERLPESFGRLSKLKTAEIDLPRLKSLPPPPAGLQRFSLISNRFARELDKGANPRDIFPPAWCNLIKAKPETVWIRDQEKFCDLGDTLPE